MKVQIFVHERDIHYPKMLLSVDIQNYVHCKTLGYQVKRASCMNYTCAHGNFGSTGSGIFMNEQYHIYLYYVVILVMQAKCSGV